MCSWTLPCASSLVISVIRLSHGFQCSPTLNRQPYWRKADTDKLVEKIVKHDGWLIQPDILKPPLLRLSSRKPLWLDLQPVDIKSRRRHNWIGSGGQFSPSVQPHNPATGFRPPSARSLLNRFRMEQGHCCACRRKTDTDLCPCGETQTMSHITLSNPISWQNWMAVYLGYTLRMKTMFRGWPVMVHDTHTRRRRLKSVYFWLSYFKNKKGTFFGTSVYYILQYMQ